MRQYLTNEGITQLSNALNGEGLVFSKVKLGNGTPPDAENYEAVARTMTDLSNTVMTVDISSIVLNTTDGYATLQTEFNNTNVDSAFHVTEVGVFVQNPDDADSDILYSVGFATENESDYVPAGSLSAWSMTLNTIIHIGTSENVTANINAAQNASQADFLSHIQNKNNPHETNKAQVGLGNVPNVTTDDQTPTFIESTTLENITSGEKLSEILGKIKKTMSAVISHLANRSNPHEVTATQVGAAAAHHSHGASDIDRGTLPIARGGTGKPLLQDGALLVGHGKESVAELSGVGALFASLRGSPQFGTLPVMLGGTGLTDGAVFRNSGNYCCYGYIELPGGLLVQWGRISVNGGDNQTELPLGRSYADTRYSLIFSCSSTQGAAPPWDNPTKAVDRFYLTNREMSSLVTHVADWITIGRAATT